MTIFFRCPCEITGDKIQTLINSIEIEFENILATEEYWKYRDILDKYSGNVLLFFIFLYLNYWNFIICKNKCRLVVFYI